jgi:CRP/FNR family transcriptional regulator, cyclic AMP receptor protein
VSDKRVPFETLRQIPAFRNFNESECHQMAEVAQERTFAPGEKVIEQGKRSQHLWILLEGKCEVIKDSRHDGPVVLAALEPHNLFGEMSFFSPAPHSANVVAKTPVRLLSISRPDYDDMIHDGVTVAYKLAYNVVENVATRLRRMDEWIADLSSHDEPAHPAETKEKEKLPEWRQFRNKVFDGWNL